MKKIILPFFILSFLAVPTQGREKRSLRLKGRVPASVKVVKDSEGANEAIESNIDKRSYSIKKIKKDKLQIFEISFH